MIAEHDSQAREAFGVEEIICLGSLSDEAVAEEIAAYGTAVPCAASIHMVPACDPDAFIEPDAFGQTTRLKINGMEVHLNFDVMTLKPSEESFLLWNRTEGQA